MGVAMTKSGEVLQKAEGDLFGKIYEYFLNKFAMTGAQEGGEFFTPFSLVNTIVNVIEPDHGIVLTLHVVVLECLCKPVILLKVKDCNLPKKLLFTVRKRLKPIPDWQK
jgi:hypothetical protein